jgi:hypothetical protein
VSRPFGRPESGKIAVKVISHYGDEDCPGHGYLAALQATEDTVWVEGRTWPDSTLFRGRAILMTWSGQLLWASSWSRNEIQHVCLSEDGSTLGYSFGNGQTVCVSVADTSSRALPEVIFGSARDAPNGSRMSVSALNRPEHNTVVVYDWAASCDPVEVLRKTWEGTYVTHAAVSASGALVAVVLQGNRASMPHCSLVILDRDGTEILHEAVPTMNPPIYFDGELLFLGASRPGERAFAGSGDIVRVYSCV